MGKPTDMVAAVRGTRVGTIAHSANLGCGQLWRLAWISLDTGWGDTDDLVLAAIQASPNHGDAARDGARADDQRSLSMVAQSDLCGGCLDPDGAGAALGFGRAGLGGGVCHHH